MSTVIADLMTLAGYRPVLVRCRRAETTRDCPRNHEYVRKPHESGADYDNEIEAYHAEWVDDDGHIIRNSA